MKIKICGLSREEDVEAVCEGGADFAGFVFYAKSARCVSASRAAALSRLLPKNIKAVGVFVDESPQTIASLYESGVIGLAQLHGTESAAYIRRLKELCAVPVIKAVRVPVAKDAVAKDAVAKDAVAKDAVAKDAAAYALSMAAAQEGGADFLLLDSGAGSGKPFDWSTLASPPPLPWFLAGGLSPENAASAAALFPPPFALDVSSGVETAGRKDRQKILAFCFAARC